jgi:hypothetical protein
VRTIVPLAFLAALSLLGTGRPSLASPLALPDAEPPRFELWAGAAPLFGLGNFLRGARADLGLGFRDSAFLPSVSLNLSWDRSFGAFVAEGLLCLGLGPGLGFHGGLLLPLAGTAVDAGGGRSLVLEPAARFALFGFDAEFASIALGENGLKLTARAFFDYRAWRIARALEGPTPSPLRREDALRAYSAGITAGIGIRLGWAPGVRKKQTPRRPRRRSREGSSSTSWA